MAKLVIVFYERNSSKKINSLLNDFTNLGSLDVACIHMTSNGSIMVENFISHSRRKVVNRSPLEISIIFPNKLKNMEGHPYKIAVYSQIPRVIIMKEQLISSLTYFMSILTKLQNATIEYSFVKRFKDIKYRWDNRLMDLTFNTGFMMLSDEIEFMTYEENYYCAIVPLPPKIPLFHVIFIKPYDSFTWILFIFTILTSFVVLWLFRNHGAVDSPFFLAFGICVTFIGQCLDFSRKNRLVLSILIQLIIVMIWVLSTAYEGVITSFMIQPIDDNRLKTFDDLVNSKYKIITSDGVAEKMRLSEAYQLLKPRLNTSGPQLGDHFRVEIQRARFVFIMNCDEMEILMPSTIPKTNIKVSQLYYMLPQKFYPNYIKLSASYLNPYLERLQYYMDLSFQAGLPYIWDVYASLANPFKKMSIEDSDTFGYLKLEDLKQVFSILLIGYALSSGLLVFEIFCHDILQKVKFTAFKQKLKNKLHQRAFKTKWNTAKKLKHSKSKKLKTQMISVLPRFSEEM